MTNYEKYCRRHDIINSKCPWQKARRWRRDCVSYEKDQRTHRWKTRSKTDVVLECVNKDRDGESPEKHKHTHTHTHTHTKKKKHSGRAEAPYSNGVTHRLNGK